MPSDSQRESKCDDTGQLPPLLTVHEVVLLTRLGRTTVYEAIRRGELPSVRVGRRVMVPSAKLRQRLCI